MRAPRFWMVVPALLVAYAVGAAYAKLPPLSDAEKTKAAEAKAKAATAAKEARVLEEKAMDRVVERYKKEKAMRTAAEGPGRK